MNQILGFNEDIVAVVIGSTGGVGDAFVQRLSQSSQCKKLIMTSRQPMVLGDIDSKHTWFSMYITNEESISSVASYMQEQNIKPNLILNLSGNFFRVQGFHCQLLLGGMRWLSLSPPSTNPFLRCLTFRH